MAKEKTPKIVHRQPDPQIKVTEKTYQEAYQQSLHHSKAFWGEQAEKTITWMRPWDEVYSGDFASYDVRWFVNGQLNACDNCVDRHLEHRADQIALIWEGSDPKDRQTYTYQALHKEVCRFANVLKAEGIQKGDRVCIYLPMIPQLVFAMLACARIGAVHSVVFSGFSADALLFRLQDTQAKLLITADESIRGDKCIPLKQNIEPILNDCPKIKRVIVVKRTGTTEIPWSEKRDAWYHDLSQNMDENCPVEPMYADDPLFILYTSGSTGKPKGVVHSTGGYMVYAALTHQVVFDHREGDVFFCTADPGWITGHSYVVYGPLANGTTTILFEGVPNYPTFSRYWDIIDAYQVTVFYTSPTALRLLRAAGDQWVTKARRHSLRLLGSVGEPIGAEIWAWYYEVVGEKRCPIMDTWWQTETGGILISALPGNSELIPGSAGMPFWGIVPEIVDDNGRVIEDDRPGRLVIKHPWPGMMRTIFNDRKRFIESYFKSVPGCYLTGDGAYRDKKGHLMITGRNDDVIKASGHRFGTEELESALISYPGIAEASVVGIPHAKKGECIIAFVSLMGSMVADDHLKTVLKQHVSDKIGPIAKPEHIYWAKGLPKTRSGKIMRRLLRHIAQHQFDELGDMSTLVDPSVVDDLIAEQKKEQNPS
ncbi:MAG: acetate--CoA ligase [Legionella sp.]|nr:MAG: acetate--CoA ligase [Legionella sp.]